MVKILHLFDALRLAGSGDSLLPHGVLELKRDVKEFEYLDHTGFVQYVNKNSEYVVE